MLTKESPSSLKFEDLRVRKANPDEIPVFRRYPDFVRNNCFIIDLEGSDTVTAEIKEESARVDAYKTKFSNKLPEDVPMEGLEVVGGALEVSMLSQSRLETDPMDSQLYKNYHSGVADEAASLEINPLSVADALYFFHNFELSDAIKNQLYKAMGFSTSNKCPKTYALNFFAKADDSQERTVGFMIRYVDSVKYAGIMNHYGPFTDGVQSLVNFKLLAHSTNTKIRAVSNQSCYNALCSLQIIISASKWPKFALPDLHIVYDDEKVDEVAEAAEANAEFIPGAFLVRTKWTDNAAAKQAALDQLTNAQFPVNYFEKPGGLFDTTVVVKPGWLDTRVKGNERSVHLRFLMFLCDCLEKEQIVWPSKREQPKLLEAFKNYVANLSAVEDAKQSYDFVEGLWDFLCCCRSLASVRAILKQTYEYYTSGVLNSKHVHVDNTSQTALILKMVDNANAVLPRLDEWTCVESVIQVGADRLRRDMMNELIHKKRFSESSFSESLKITARDDPAERINKILRMHLILQSVNLIAEHVNVQPAETQNIFNMLISQYSKFEIKKQINRTMLSEEFSFSTKVCTVEAVVFELTRLREWSVTYDFLDKSGVRSSYVVHLTRFSEFKKLAKCDFSDRFRALSMTNRVCDEKLSWDNFECCTFSYAQKSAFSTSNSSSV